MTGRFVNWHATATDRRPCVRLVFFSAKPAAEPLVIDLDLVHRHPGNFANGTLNGGRPLRRRIDLYSAVLGRDGICTLRLDVKMFLAVDVGAALENMFACRKKLFRYRRAMNFFGGTIRSPFAAATRGSVTGSSGSISAVIFFAAFACKLFAGRDNDRDRHSLKVDFAVGKQRLVRNDSADLVFADDVFCSDDANDAFACFRLARVDAIQLSMSNRRIKHTREQRPLNKRNIVHINGLAADV